MGACCANQMSAFCPDCGANLRANPLPALLSHLRKRATEYEGLVKVGSERHGAAADKWRGWVTAVEAVLEEMQAEGSSEPQPEREGDKRDG